jgi:hypothetical protein
MPYLLVRESYMNGCCMVDGLPLNEFRILGEKCSATPDTRDEKNRSGKDMYITSDVRY